MEQELRCPLCERFFEDPVVLPCFHSACFSCVERNVDQLLPSALRAKTGAVIRGLGQEERNEFEGMPRITRPLRSSASSTTLPNFEHKHEQWKRRMSSCTDTGIEIRGNRGMPEIKPEPLNMGRLHKFGFVRDSSNDGNSSNHIQFEGLGESNIELFIDKDVSSFDKMSITSETDSGVICDSSSRSAFCTSSGPTLNSYNYEPQGTQQLFCPACNHFIYLNSKGADGLMRNRAIETLVEKYVIQQSPHIECQLCEDSQKSLAVVTCEQCEVSYCQKCLEICHPLRGPLAKHTLMNPAEGVVSLKAKHKNPILKCGEHKEESFSTFCVTCQMPACCLCLHSGNHVGHPLQTVTAACKAHKVELSQMLHKLSERARSTSDLIKELKAVQPSVKANCLESEALIVAKCDTLIEAIQKRKQQLLEKLDHEKLHREELCESQIKRSTAELQKATGLLQLNIELLKEADPVAFLQISRGLMNRIMAADQNFHQNFPVDSKILSTFDIHLGIEPILQAIQSLNFYQQKVPSCPIIILEECNAEQNTVTISWRLPESSSPADGYILELAEASDSEFHEVFCGTETLCLVEGLHFNTQYLAHVKAFNHAGHGQFCDCICLRTARVTSFTFDSNSCHPDVKLTNGNLVASCDSTDSCVILGSVGVSRGLHYWEFFVDQFENNCDPAFGIARFDVEKGIMLGKSERAWSMYIDGNRSWFMHAGEHHARIEGGIRVGSKVGVLLNLDAHTLNFYVNEKLCGSGPAFRNLRGVFYPAVSINRHVKITLNSGINPPSNIYDED